MGIIRLHSQKEAVLRLSQFGVSSAMPKLLPYVIKYLRQRETIESSGIYDMLSASATEKAIALVVALSATERRDDHDRYRAALRGELLSRTTHSYTTARELPERGSRLSIVLDLAYRYPDRIRTLRTAIREHGYDDSVFLVEIMNHDTPALIRGML